MTNYDMIITIKSDYCCDLIITSNMMFSQKNKKKLYCLGQIGHKKKFTQKDLDLISNKWSSQVMGNIRFLTKKNY